MGRHKAVGDDEILDAARRVFAAEGHAASTRDVARAAGISQAVLYQRFRDKNALFFAAMRPPAPDIDTLLGPVVADIAPGAAEAYLAGLTERLLSYFEETAPTMLHVLTHPAFGTHGLARAHEELLANALIAAVAERIATLAAQRALEASDPHATAETLIAAVHSAAIFGVLASHGVHPAPSGKRDSETQGRAERGARIAGVLWRGLAPRRERSSGRPGR